MAEQPPLAKGERREFLSGWPASQPMVWSERNEDELIGSSKGGHLLVPGFTPFDFIPEPNKRVLFLSAPSNRAYIDAPRGTEQYFHRNADIEELVFHMAGETVYETEGGVYTVRPGELFLIPSGIAFRVTGKKDALRIIMQTRDALEVKYNEASHVGHTEYDVEWVGAPNWPAPPDSQLYPKGKIIESVHTWDDEPGQETLIERDYDRLVGAVKAGHGIVQLRLFDIFKEMTGKRGPGPVSFTNADFFMECYNTVGEQWAYHRANRSDEAQLQFCGAAENISEFGSDLMDSGNIYIQRRGISHRVKGSPFYRRMVFYSREQWKVHLDPKKPLRQTSFKVSERILEHAPWRDEIAQYLQDALKR